MRVRIIGHRLYYVLISKGKLQSIKWSDFTSPENDVVNKVKHSCVLGIIFNS